MDSCTTVIEQKVAVPVTPPAGTGIEDTNKADLAGKNGDFISVILAVKNEEGYIERCMRSLLEQDFPGVRYQIIIVDGQSTDNTLGIVGKLMKEYPGMIKVVSNPKMWVAPGRNVGIASATGSNLIAYMDGHCIAAGDWLKTLYQGYLEEAGPMIGGVGSLGFDVSPQDESLVGSAIEQVVNSLLVVLTPYMMAKVRSEAATAPYVLYRKEALERSGMYDEDMKCGEDFVLNHKIRKAGYKLFVEPRAIVYHYKRNSIRGFYHQMWNYGFAKAVISKRYPGACPAAHFLPPFVILLMASLAAASIFLSALRLFIVPAALLYVATIIGFSLYTAMRKRRWEMGLLMPVLYVTQHIGYTLGFFKGLLGKGWQKELEAVVMRASSESNI